MPTKKTFARSANEIRPLAEGHGACIATDEIMVKGRRVGYAYREEPDRMGDSGWRFTAGDESDEYMDDADNHGIYDLNTVANYDPDIIPLVGARFGSAFVRDPVTGRFVAVEGGEDEFPRVEGVYAMTKTWSIELPPGQFKRRLEDGSLVLWRDGITAWINVWANDANEPAAKRLATIRDGRSSKAFDLREETASGLLYDSYRLKEKHWAASLYAFAVGATGHVQMAVYVDDERDLEVARAMWRGLREHGAGSRGMT